MPLRLLKRGATKQGERTPRRRGALISMAGRAAVVGCVLLGVGVWVPAADATPITSADVQALPTHPESRPLPNQFAGASDQYVMHTVHDLSSYDGHNHFTVVRISDGAVVWSDFDASPDAQAESLVGQYYVEKVGGSGNFPTSVRFFDIATHQKVGEIAVPDSESLGGIGPGWIVDSHYGGDPIPGSFMVIRRLDGTTVQLPGVGVDNVYGLSGSDATHAWVHDGYGGPLYDVNIVAGTAAVVPKPAGVTWGSVVVGPTSYFNVTSHGSDSYTIDVVNRTSGSSSSHNVTLDGGENGNVPAFLPLGNGLGVYRGPAAPLPGKLWSLDLDTNTQGATIADHASDARSVGTNGRVVIVDETAVPGSLKVDDGAGLTTVRDLPPVSATTEDFAYDGVVRDTWGDGTTWSVDPTAATPTWTDTGQTTGQTVTSSGGVTLVNDVDPVSGPTNHWHLYWSGGHRDIVGFGLVLGHGGKLLVRPSNAESTAYQVERVTTGAVVATAGDRGATADGSWVWTWSAQNVLSGVDIDHPATPHKTVQVPAEGGPPILADVRGRWALISNASNIVVDTTGVVPPWQVPGANIGSGAAPAEPALGAGFIVWSRWTYNANHQVIGRLTQVANLTNAHTTQELADPSTGVYPTRYRPDEQGSASIAFVDQAGQPKIAHLPWLANAPAPLTDNAPPVLGATTGPAAVTPSTGPRDFDFSWTYTDPATATSTSSGIAEYAVRYRTRTGQGAYGSWTTTLSIAAAQLSTSVPVGKELCAQAMAIDADGNASAWSPARCARVDGAAPTLAAATGSPKFTAPDSHGMVSYSYRAVDDDQVQSYDVQVRTAVNGAGLSTTWKALKNATTATTVRVSASAGSERCFRFRARDRAGNVSAWAPQRCSSVAVQDKAFNRSGTGSRMTSKLALDGSYTRLRERGAYLKLSTPQTGHVLAVWVLAGPGQGTADVYIGSTKVGSIALAARTWRAKLVQFTMTRSGTVKIVQHGKGSIDIDAIAVAR